MNQNVADSNKVFSMDTISCKISTYHFEIAVSGRKNVQLHLYWKRLPIQSFWEQLLWNTHMSVLLLKFANFVWLLHRSGNVLNLKTILNSHQYCHHTSFPAIPSQTFPLVYGYGVKRFCVWILYGNKARHLSIIVCEAVSLNWHAAAVFWTNFLG